MNSTDTRDHILHRPLPAQDIEKLKAGGANVRTFGDGIRDLASIQSVEKLRINKVGVICCVAQKEFIIIETLKPSLIKSLFKNMGFIP